MAVLILIITTMANLACLVIGVSIGQKVAKGEEIVIPKPSEVVDSIKENREKREARREAEREAEKLDAILENITNYNGTSVGQRDVPRG